MLLQYAAGSYDVAVIGAGHAGIEAALNAGLRVYALRPRHGERIDQSRATAVISSLSQVLELAKET